MPGLHCVPAEAFGCSPNSHCLFTGGPAGLSQASGRINKCKHERFFFLWNFPDLEMSSEKELFTGKRNPREPLTNDGTGRPS